jgi:hypothetical protein
MSPGNSDIEYEARPKEETLLHAYRNNLWFRETKSGPLESSISHIECHRDLLMTNFPNTRERAVNPMYKGEFSVDFSLEFLLGD